MKHYQIKLIEFGNIVCSRRVFKNPSNGNISIDDDEETPLEDDEIFVKVALFGFAVIDIIDFVFDNGFHELTVRRGPAALFVSAV